MSFLKYTGVYTRKGEKYVFEMNDNVKKLSKFYTTLNNPTYDNSFKNMFCSEKSITKSFLNSVLFPKSKLIEKIEFSKTYFAGKSLVNNRYGYGSKSIDVGCKLFLKKNNGLNIKGNILICDVEMQIGFSDEIEKRFIDYANKIRVDSNYQDTWVVSFILKESIDNKNNKVQLNKVDTDGVVKMKDFQLMKIIEINLNYCNFLLKKNKEIEIIDGEVLDIPGREWIKMLCIPLWCKSHWINESVYILPELSKKFIKCSFLRKAMNKIVHKDQLFDLSDVDEHYNRIERKNYVKLQKEIKELRKKLKQYEEAEKEDDGFRYENAEEEEEEIDSDEGDQDNDENGREEEDEDEQNDDKQDEDDKDISEEDDKNMDIDSDE